MTLEVCNENQLNKPPVNGDAAKTESSPTAATTTVQSAPAAVAATSSAQAVQSAPESPGSPLTESAVQESEQTASDVPESEQPVSEEPVSEEPVSEESMPDGTDTEASAAASSDSASSDTDASDTDALDAESQDDEALNDEAQDDEATDSEVSAPASTEHQLPADLVKIIDVRIGLWEHLLDLQRKREDIGKVAGTREIRQEIARQNSELKKIPDEEKFAIAVKKLESFKAYEPTLPDEGDIDPEEAEAQLATFKAQVREIAEIGQTQHKLLNARRGLDQVVPKAATPLYPNEPLYEATKDTDADLTNLIAWTYYCAGVTKVIEQCKLQEAAHKEEVAEAQKQQEDKGGGLMSKFRRSNKNTAPIPELDPKIIKRKKAAESEFGAIEPLLSEDYWNKYETIAVNYCKEKYESSFLPAIRGYLRYGLVCSHKMLIDEKKSGHIIKECTEQVYKWKDDSESTHVLYADEYILAIAQRRLSVSPDEELELNGRGGDMWRADRTWRLTVSAKAKSVLYNKTLEGLEADAKKSEDKVEKLQQKADAVKEDPEKREELVKYRKEISDLRPEAARCKQMAERMRDRLLPSLTGLIADGESKQGEAEMILPLESVIRREAGFVRRMARLSARLKTPYMQFVLRDHFTPLKSAHHTRGGVMDSIRKVEYADQYIFHEIVVPNKKKDRRLTIRMSPVFLIVPARGTMGLSLAPRRGTETGKLMVPLLGQRPNMIDETVVEILSDFGWDCTIETAGADWITSDTFCAGYANVRWNYRKRSPDMQKRAGIDKKLQDRINWRRHYALYVFSAEEAGKKLFNKCHEAYEVIAKYVGLPPGQEKLKRE